MDFHRVEYAITKDDIDKLEYENKRVGVIIHIEDSEGKILLQQRGIKSRDENGLYEDVGGSVDSTDENYLEAIKREMLEEMGSNIKVEIKDTLGIYHVQKKDINWVFIVFAGKYIEGEAEIMEPDKCIGYKFFSYDETQNSNLLSESCKFLIQQIKNIN